MTLLTFRLTTILLVAIPDALWTVGEVMAVILLIPCTIYLFWLVHRSLENYCYVPHARKWCRRNGLEPRSWKCEIALDKSGVKSELSIVELECIDGNGQRRLVRLLVWLTGVKVVLSIEPPMDEPDDDSNGIGDKRHI